MGAEPWFAGLRAKWSGTSPSEEARWHKKLVAGERRVERLEIALRRAEGSHE